MHCWVYCVKIKPDLDHAPARFAEGAAPHFWSADILSAFRPAMLDECTAADKNVGAPK
jgi:hypothetical protein